MSDPSVHRCKTFNNPLPHDAIDRMATEESETPPQIHPVECREQTDGDIPDVTPEPAFAELPTGESVPVSRRVILKIIGHGP